MENNKKSTEKINFKRITKIGLILIAALFLATCAVLPVYAWLTSGQRFAGYIPISAPESLYIGTGNGEDIKYLYFTGVDVTNEVNYVEYVISVQGEGIGDYRLQLGYTTNNQLTYGIYSVSGEPTNVEPASLDGYVQYLTQDSTFYYYRKGSPLQLVFLNKDDPDEGEPIIATNEYHGETYCEYSLVNEFAEPIYLQTANRINTGTNNYFIHYYILRIEWEKGTNNRETDIVCIAAKSGS